MDRIRFRLSVAVAMLGVLAGSAHATNQISETADAPVLHSTLVAMAGTLSRPADVKPGDTVTIVGECVGQAQSADALRVVLRLAAQSGAPDPGFRQMLATDQAISGDGLNVRVPDVPEAANRVFKVKVFRLDEQTPQVCDAGAIRIGSSDAGKVG